MIVKESPLNGINIGTLATVMIRELPGLSTVDLRVALESSAYVAVADKLCMELPRKTGHIFPVSVLSGNEAYALCLGPNSWLLIGLPQAEQQLTSLRLKSDCHFSAVDVSSQRTTLELEGPRVREVLAHLWDQDIREKNFPIARVSQGLMAKAPVILYRIAPYRYRMMVRSSFALHVWKVLADTAEEYM